jgi:integrase
MSKSTRSGRVAKPKKPYPDFPLFPHATRRWAKKIRGKLYYFGPWSDGWQAALDRYLKERDDLYAGRDPHAAQPEGYTLGKLCNEFLNAKKADMELGKITPTHFGNLFRACERMVVFWGAGRAAESIGPDDFERLGYSYPATWKLRRRKLEIGAVRSVFNYAALKEKIVRTRFGTLKGPSRDELDAERFARERKHGTREFAPEQLRKVIDAAPRPLRAMILLAVNCGYGNTDIATLPLAYLDLEGGWANYPRPKTTIRRRAALWPETVAALREAIARRPDPLDPEDAGLVFVTVTGLRWVRAAVVKNAEGGVEVKADDSVTRAFRVLLAGLGIRRPGLSFYSLRHCTETHGGADQVALDCVMGHRTPGMGTNYRQSIADARLKAVADSIHAWLFGR